MNFVKQIVVGLPLIYALAMPALAQGIPQGLTNLREGMALIVSPSGKVTTMPMTSKAMPDAMLEEGTKITTGMIIVRRNGELFLVPDKKMPDGKTLSETMTHR